MLGDDLGSIEKVENAENYNFGRHGFDLPMEVDAELIKLLKNIVESTIIKIFPSPLYKYIQTYIPMHPKTPQFPSFITKQLHPK